MLLLSEIKLYNEKMLLSMHTYHIYITNREKHENRKNVT